MKLRCLRLAAVIILVFSPQRLPAPVEEESTPPPRRAAKVVAPQKKSPPPERGVGHDSVQVILTDNTRAAMIYLKNYEGKAFSDVRSDDILQKLRQALSARFRNVSMSESSSASRSGGLTMLFDLQAHVGSISFTTNTVSFIATFKNGDGRTIQTISAAGKSTVPYPAFGLQFSNAVSRAFADFSQKLGAMQ